MLQREKKSPDLPFYKEGLHFKCKRCSACCRITPGYVFLSENDLIGLLKFTGESEHSFFDNYLRPVNVLGIYRISLKEKDNYDCIFWEEKGCLVYPKRPFQCRSYPFWASFLYSKKMWEDQKESCPGMDCGPRISRRRIDSWIRMRQKEKYIELAPETVSLYFKNPSLLLDNFRKMKSV